MFKVSLLDIKSASVLFEDFVQCVILPGEEGELSVFDFHQAMLVKLKKGTITIDREHVLIRKGIAKMLNNELTILAETRHA